MPVVYVYSMCISCDVDVKTCHICINPKTTSKTHTHAPYDIILVSEVELASNTDQNLAHNFNLKPFFYQIHDDSPTPSMTLMALKTIHSAKTCKLQTKGKGRKDNKKE